MCIEEICDQRATRILFETRTEFSVITRFNIFRRFRITELQTAECPKPLQHFWSGHAQTHVSERYTKLLQDRDYRLEWAEKIGMGFELPARSVAPRAPLIMFRKAG